MSVRGVYAYEAYEAKLRVALVRVPCYFINLWLISYRHRCCTYLYYLYAIQAYRHVCIVLPYGLRLLLLICSSTCMWTRVYCVTIYRDAHTNYLAYEHVYALRLPLLICYHIQGYTHKRPCWEEEAGRVQKRRRVTTRLPVCVCERESECVCTCILTYVFM